MDYQQRLVFVSASRSPFEIFMLFACILSGIAGLINPHRVSVIASVLPLWELYIWNAGIITGGFVALIGVWKSSFASLYVERIGLTLLVGLSFMYVVAIIALSGFTFGLAVMMTAAFSIACVFRLRQIIVDLRRIRLAVDPK